MVANSPPKDPPAPHESGMASPSGGYYYLTIHPMSEAMQASARKLCAAPWRLVVRIVLLRGEAAEADLDIGPARPRCATHNSGRLTSDSVSESVSDPEWVSTSGPGSHKTTTAMINTTTATATNNATPSKYSTNRGDILSQYGYGEKRYT